MTETCVLFDVTHRMWSQGDSNFNEHNILCWSKSIPQCFTDAETHLPSNVISFELKVQQCTVMLSADSLNTAVPRRHVLSSSASSLSVTSTGVSAGPAGFSSAPHWRTEEQNTAYYWEMLQLFPLKHKQCCGHTYFFWMASCLSHRETETERLYSNQFEQKPTSFIRYIKHSLNRRVLLTGIANVWW